MGMKGFAVGFLASLASSSIASAACLSATDTGDRITLKNSCNQYVSWAMCVRVAGRSFDDYPVGSTAPNGISEYGIFGKLDSYQVNSCTGKGCKVSQPRCPEAKAKGGLDAAQSFEQCKQTQCDPEWNATKVRCGVKPGYVTMEQARPVMDCINKAFSESLACMNRCRKLAK